MCNKEREKRNIIIETKILNKMIIMLLNLPNANVPFLAYLPVNYIYRYALRQVENHLQKLPKKKKHVPC